METLAEKIIGVLESGRKQESAAENYGVRHGDILEIIRAMCVENIRSSEAPKRRGDKHLTAVKKLLKLALRDTHNPDLFGCVLPQDGGRAMVTNTRMAILAPRAWFDGLPDGLYFENSSAAGDQVPPDGARIVPDTKDTPDTVTITRQDVTAWKHVAKSRFWSPQERLLVPTHPRHLKDGEAQVGINSTYLEIAMDALGVDSLTLRCSTSSCVPYVAQGGDVTIVFAGMYLDNPGEGYCQAVADFWGPAVAALPTEPAENTALTA